MPFLCIPTVLLMELRVQEIKCVPKAPIHARQGSEPSLSSRSSKLKSCPQSGGQCVSHSSLGINSPGIWHSLIKKVGELIPKVIVHTGQTLDLLEKEGPWFCLQIRCSGNALPSLDPTMMLITWCSKRAGRAQSVVLRCGSHEFVLTAPLSSHSRGTLEHQVVKIASLREA